MRTIVVTPTPVDWPLDVPEVAVVSAKDYLTDPVWSEVRGLRVVNLCRSYRYQSDGYYVSLLAAARRHRPFPDLLTVLDMKSRHFVRTVDEELDRLIQSSLRDLDTSEFDLSVYFGKNPDAAQARLAQRLASLVPAPMLRARFRRKKRWHMTSITPIAARDVLPNHQEFMIEAAGDYLLRPRDRVRARHDTGYDLAILHDPDEELAPSDRRALARFQRAGRQVGFGVALIQRSDFGRLLEFDALLLRETTYVNHHTFRFAQRAEASGMVVIDDPTSILRCTNKVYQAESLRLHGVPIPKTLVTATADAQAIEEAIGFPCVLKFPDSSFSQGVFKCADRAELEQRAELALSESDLLVAQEYLPTEFDWRIGIFEGQVLYACRYLMANGHWQIVKKTDAGSFRYGRVEPVELSNVPKRVLTTAVRAASVIGDGLYGVDIKVVGRRVVVTEVNDNPNIDAGCEDAILEDELYLRIMRGMLARVESMKRSAP